MTTTAACPCLQQQLSDLRRLNRCLENEVSIALFSSTFQHTATIHWLLKGKAEHLYSALHGIQTTLKRSGMDHIVSPAINTTPAFYLVSVHQMAPSPIEVANI